MEIRRAGLADVPGIAMLVGRFAGRGEILPRSIEDIYQTVREWVVAERDGQIIGCGALVILWADLAEIRSLVVAPEAQGEGAGRQLVNLLTAQAAELGIPQVFALTRKTSFFLNLGFQVVPRESLPRKIWKDCITCTKFVGCDEVAVARSVPVEMMPAAQIGLAGSLALASSGNGADLPERARASQERRLVGP